MAPFVRLWFSDGRLLIEGEGARLGLSERDARSRCYTAEPHDYAALLAEAARQRIQVDDEIAPLLAPPSLPWALAAVDERHLDLLWSLGQSGGSGRVALPRSRGRVSFAAAAVAAASTSALLLCRSEAAAARWQQALAEALGVEVTRDAQGGEVVGAPSVLALPSAPAALRSCGQRFGLVLIDDADRLDPAALDDALRACVAPQRIALETPAGLEAEGDEAGMARGAVAGALSRERSDGREVEVVRLYLALDDDERRDFEQALRAVADGVRARAAWLRARSLAALPRRKREKLRELILRHRGRRVWVVSTLPRGLAAPSLASLLDELPLPARGELTSLERAGTLRFVAAHHLPAGNPEADIVLLTGGPRAAALRAVVNGVSGGLRVYDLRARDTPEDPCWRWPLWHPGGDASHGEEEDPGGHTRLSGASGAALPGALRRQL